MKNNSSHNYIQILRETGLERGRIEEEYYRGPPQNVDKLCTHIDHNIKIIQLYVGYCLMYIRLIMKIACFTGFDNLLLQY